MRPCLLRVASNSRSRPSSLGKALSKSSFPARSTATTWCSPLPTSRPIKTSMLSWFPMTSTSQSQQLIPLLDRPRCQSPAFTLHTTIPNCPASCSGLSGTYRTPVTTPPGSLTTGGGNHAGASRPAHPHPATGLGLRKRQRGVTGDHSPGPYPGAWPARRTPVLSPPATSRCLPAPCRFCTGHAGRPRPR